MCVSLGTHIVCKVVQKFDALPLLFAEPRKVEKDIRIEPDTEDPCAHTADGPDNNSIL